VRYHIVSCHRWPWLIPGASRLSDKICRWQVWWGLPKGAHGEVELLIAKRDQADGVMSLLLLLLLLAIKDFLVVAAGQSASPAQSQCS